MAPTDQLFSYRPLAVTFLLLTNESYVEQDANFNIYGDEQMISINTG